MIGNSNYEINFKTKLLLTDRQVSKFHLNNLSANIKLLKTQLSKIAQ